jgi:DNA-binding CsgD family transcriptional regulator/tetratricopeptide (TPR) repeat protein
MRVLRVLAILGPGASLLDVASVLGELPSELVDDIEVARRSGLVIDEEGRLRFRHDVLRSAFVAELGPSVRAALHRQAAKSLRANGSPASAVAPHLLAGAQPGDRSAIDDLRTAAHEVERTSLPTAVELLDAAAELAKAEPALATTITAESVPLLTWSGELDEAIARAFRVLNGPLAAEAELEVRRDLAEALALAGRIDEAVQHATAAIATGTAMGPAALELEALSLLAHRFDPLTAMAAGHDLTRRSLEVGAHAAAAMVAYFEALYALDARVLPIALDRSESAVRQARAAAGRELAAGRTAARLIAALEVRGAALNLVDRVAEAEVSLSEARLLATDLGARVILPDLFVGLANCAFERGALDVARAELDAVAELVGDPHVAPLLQLAVSVASGAFDVADELWAALVWHPADRQLATHWWGRRLVFGGRHDEALTLLADEFRRTGQAGETWQARTGSFPLVRLAQRAGDVGLVDALARAAAAAADAARGVLTMQATAELVAAIGREDLPAAQDAVRRFRSAGLPHRTTTAGVELAHLARRVGEPDAARQAAADVAELGARHGLHDAVLASVLLESLSDPARRRPRGVPRATSGWDSLTPTELKVVAEVSRGRTNPQIATELFVSRHTVDSHVKHVFTKLGISSRVELATLAARRGADIP